MPSAIPQHLAIVMDGNGRWAKEHMLSRSEGHRAGKDALREIVAHCVKVGVRYLTVFAFSSENWRRPTDEVSALLRLFESALNQETSELAKSGVRLKMIGDLSRFPLALRKMIELSESRTQNHDRLYLTVAINYGGRWDIINAIRGLIREGHLVDEPLSEERFAKHLSLGKYPDPDLLIRTGGEQRVSNFLLWQIAYSEIYFSDTLWPEFTPAHLDRAFAWFAGRERRFGQTSDQLIESDNADKDVANNADQKVKSASLWQLLRSKTEDSPKQQAG